MGVALLSAVLLVLSLALALPADGAMTRLAVLSSDLRGDRVVRRPAPAIKLSQLLKRNQLDEAKKLQKRAARYIKEGRYADAEALIRQALETKERWLGAAHFGVAESLNVLGKLYRIQGRYAEAETLMKQALAIKEQAFGSGHLRIATTLDNLATLYRIQGRYTEAEPLIKRALAIWERARGPDHPRVATTLGSLAALYLSQGRYAEVEPLVARALAILEEEKGADNPLVASQLSNLARIYLLQDRATEAEPLIKRALAIWEKARGVDHLQVGKTLNQLALSYQDQERIAEAEPLVERALGIFERVLGPNHPNVANALIALAGLYRDQELYAEAAPRLERALAINQKILGADHPRLAKTLSKLAGIYKKQRRHAEALDYIRRASNIHRARATRASDSRSVGVLAEQKKVRGVFVSHVKHLADAMERDPEQCGPLLSESFNVGQLAQATSAAAAVASMAACFAAGDDDLARTVRASQDAIERWWFLDARLDDAVADSLEARDAEAEARLRGDLAALDARIAALGKQLAEDFPEFAELAGPRPLSLAETQALPGPDEALMTYAVWDEVTFLWVICRDDAAFHKLDLGRLDLEDAVTFIRGGLDRAGSIPIFDVEEALALYRKIFAPAEAMLESARHVFVVPDGALQSLPLGVLITEQPENWARRPKLSAYRDVEWLAKKYAMTVLPSVSSLRALRQFAKTAQASRPFIGFGDPDLGGGDAAGRGVDVASLFTRGAVADVDAVRELARLPATRRMS